MKRSLTVIQVWALMDKGIKVYCGSDAYQVVVETVHHNEQSSAGMYQRNHFTHRNNQVLSVRCMSNWFGSIMHPTDLGNLYLKIED